MTTSKDFNSISRPAGADLSTALNKFARLDAAGNVVLAGAAQKVLGTITWEGGLGELVSVQTLGQGKVIVGAAPIAAGAQINSDANGLAATGTTNAVGVAFLGGAVGTVIEFAFV